MLRSKTTASSDMRLYASQKTIGLSFGSAFIAMRPITTAFFGVVSGDAIQKRTIVRPTMTSLVFSHYVK